MPPRSPSRTVHVAVPAHAPADGNLALVRAYLATSGWDVRDITVALDDVAAGLGGETRRTFELFQHTPEPLIHAWLFARGVAAAVPDGAVVLVSDVAGLGGMLALEESTRPVGERRTIWTTAGSGLSLEMMATAGTIDHVEMPDASLLDWEIVQYRNAADVLATSAIAAELLADLGVDASVAVGVDEADPAGAPGPIGTVWVPGPVSRRNRTGDILRALASHTEVSVTVGDTDDLDRVWSGTTWDTLEGVRATFGHRLRRSDRPASAPDAVIVGDPLSPPDDATVALRADGVPLLVPRGSVAAAMWPDVPTWETSDDLSRLIDGDVTPRARIDRWSGPSDVAPGDDTRARRVSVGIPVFGASPFLDACVESVLGQTVPPHEVLLIDDGSQSGDVDASLRAWAERAPGVVRVLRQPNRGVCVARNRMIAEMTGDAFLLVDQDDELRPTCIETTARALRSDRSLAAVAVWTEFFGEYHAVEAKPPFDRRVGLRENPIVSTAALVDMRVRDHGVAFEPDLAFLYCEDWNVWSQIVASGGRIGLVPEPLIRHRVHRASGGFQRTELAHRIGKARATEPLRPAPGD